MNIININSNEQENSMRDRSVRDIHLEKAFVYVIDANLKVFAEAIGVLAKISEQILFQPFHDCLVLSAFNSTKSAYGKITFYANFFSRCESNVDVDGLGVGGDITCRISARSALHIFKNVCTRSGGLHMPGFDLCQLEFDPRADFAIVHLQQQPAQIKRAFLLPMKEQTVTFDNIFTEKHRLKNRLSTQARLFLNMFAGLDCQQARLLASSTQFSAHRYISREDLNKIRKTEVTIPVENFELYHVHLNTQIVISLRELRSILNFMESCGLSLSLHFDRAGRPLIVALEDNLDFGAEFVLATLDDGEREREQQRTVPDQQQANLVLLAQNPSQRVQMTPGVEPESRPSIAKRLLALASLQTEEEANENRYSASFC